MDEAVRLENISMMNACDDAELRLRILRNNATQAQELNVYPEQSQAIHQAHDALEGIWYKALPAPIGSQKEWNTCRRSVNDTIALIDAMAQQMDTGKFDFQEFKTPENRHNLLLAIKTIEICRINLRAYDKDEYYDLDRQALDQLELMLHSALGLIQTIYDLLKH